MGDISQDQTKLAAGANVETGCPREPLDGASSWSRELCSGALKFRQTERGGCSGEGGMEAVGSRTLLPPRGF